MKTINTLIFTLSFVLVSLFTNAQVLVCDSATLLECGDTYISNTNTEQNTLNITNYGCDNTYDYNGKDAFFRVDAQASTKLTIKLTELSGDLDLIVYKNGCSPSECVAISNYGGTADEVLTFENPSGTYYIVVDAYLENIESAYTISIDCEQACTTVEETNCDDLTYAYAGTTAGELRYYFAVPNVHIGGYWQASRLDINDPSDLYEQRLGNNQNITHTFPKAGTYIVCYIYTDSNGCEVICSKNILIKNPYECDFIDRTFDPSNHTWTLSWNEHISATPIQWNNLSTTQPLGTSAMSISLASPSEGLCHQIQVLYYDPVDSRHAICRTEICTLAIDEDECETDYNNLVWLKNLKTNLSTNCGIDEFSGASISSGLLNGDCVYLATIYGFDSLLEVLYDASGNKICESNNILGFHCDKINNIANRAIIWQCQDETSTACAEISGGEVTCLDSGAYKYTFTLKNNSNEAVASNFIVMDAGISFDACTNILSFFTPANQSDEISFSFEHCFGTITAGDKVSIFAQFFDENDRLCSSKVFDIRLECTDSNGDDDDEPLCFGTGNNLVTNGDFEAGNWAFENSFPQGCWCTIDTYCVSTNAQNKCSDLPSHTMDNKFLIIQKSLSNDGYVWTQNVQIENGKTYAFSFDLLGFNNAPDTELKIGMGGELAKVVKTKAGQNIRQGTHWTANYTGTIKINILHQYAVGSSPYAFGIDNIEFIECGVFSPNVEGDTFDNNTPKVENTVKALCNAPNPFSAMTMIQFQVETETQGTFRVRDLNGRILYNREEIFYAGENAIEFQASGLASGTYLYEIETADFVERKKMIIQ